MNYTKNYRLPQWVKEDRIMMDDFNAAMSSMESGMTRTDAKPTPPSLPPTPPSRSPTPRPTPSPTPWATTPPPERTRRSAWASAPRSSSSPAWGIPNCQTATPPGRFTSDSPQETRSPAGLDLQTEVLSSTSRERMSCVRTTASMERSMTTSRSSNKGNPQGPRPLGVLCWVRDMRFTSGRDYAFVPSSSSPDPSSGLETTLVIGVLFTMKESSV